MDKNFDFAGREKEKGRKRKDGQRKKQPKRGSNLSGRGDFASETEANLRVNSLGDKLAELRRKYSWHYAYA